jgi:hypothetical protein
VFRNAEERQVEAHPSGRQRVHRTPGAHGILTPP